MANWGLFRFPLVSDENCCASQLITGSDFNRDNDPDYPATISDFRLDKYEVTVGRFRKFVDAVVEGWRPVGGSGKHTHLNGGAGLVNSAAGAGNETGWDTAWNANLPAMKTTWDGPSYLACPQTTWTPSSGANENHPISCVNWYQAVAFCIWDGGFLPSEAEWSYAATGGKQQRRYPWSSPAESTTIDCSYANYRGAAGGSDYCVTSATGPTSPVGSLSPKGNGLYGQADLAGNVWEWNLDWSGDYSTDCNNCVNLPPSLTRVIRGGSFFQDASLLLSSYRDSTDAPYARYNNLGLRCARAP